MSMACDHKARTEYRLIQRIDFLYSRLLSKQSVDVFQGLSYKQLAANVADKSA